MNVESLCFITGNANKPLQNMKYADGIGIVDEQIFTEQCLQGTNFQCMCFDEYDKLAEAMETFEGIKNIKICPVMRFDLDYKEMLRDMKAVLSKLIIISKVVYGISMSNQNLKVWFINQPNAVGTNHPELAEAFSGGVSTMAKVLGLELAKKKVHSNYIKIVDDSKVEQLIEFLDWTSDRDMYLNLQDIEF